MIPDRQVPELQRGELAGTVLQLKALGIDNVMAFDYLAPPPAEAMVKAAELLFALGAIDNQSRCLSSLTPACTVAQAAARLPMPTLFLFLAPKSIPIPAVAPTTSPDPMPTLAVSPI